jgi:hypothetical protein
MKESLLMDLHIFGIPNYEKVVFGILSDCMYAWLHALLESEQTDFIHVRYLRFHPSRVVPGDSEHSSSKIQNYYFLKNKPNDFYSILAIYGNRITK